MPPERVRKTVSAQDFSSVKSLREFGDGGTGMPCSRNVNPGSRLIGGGEDDGSANGSGADR